VKVSKRKEIYKENQSSNYVYFIDKGLVKTYSMDESGKELVIDIQRTGQFFGFCSLKELKTYTETASALKNCELYRVTSSEFRNILAENPRLTLELVDILSDKVATLKQHLLQMAYATVLQKTIKTLIEFAVKLSDDPCELVTVSRTDLASVAGISTESFIRCLAHLKNERLIEVDGRRITILNLQKLKQIR
jgi:CRP-like cAMP-binding protein